MDVLNKIQTKSGNYIELVGKTGQENILIVGVVHGDEPQGKFLVDEYLRQRYDYPDTSDKLDIESQKFCETKGKHNLLFIPCLNPDGMQHATRTNANGVDLNRNFPTRNWGQNCGENATCDDETSSYFGGKVPASEIETLFLIDTIEKYNPKLVLTLHALYKTVNYDGPAKQTAEMVSEIIKYPVEESIGYPTPGSFGTWAGVERNIPVITLEMDEICPVEELITPIFKIFDNLQIF